MCKGFLTRPARVQEIDRLRLDDNPSWVIVSDHNADEWPNAGLTHSPTGPKDSATGVQAAACATQQAGSDREAVGIPERVRRGAGGVAASERRKVCKKL